MKKQDKNSCQLVNYTTVNSDTNNYSLFQSSSSPMSFPELMENGIIINYENKQYSSEIILE